MTDFSALHDKAIAAAAAQHKSGLFGTGQCLMRVRRCYGIGAKFPSAAKGWAGADFKHRSSAHGIPRGVPIWWVGGSHGFGHVAISLGNGLCETTDYVRRGGFGVAHIDDITRDWRLTFMGWTEDINGVRVYERPQERRPPTPKPVTPENALVRYRAALEAADKDYGVHIKRTRRAAQRLRNAVHDALAAAPKK